MAARLRAEQGWAVVASMVLMVVTLVMGLALLAMVDVQTQETQRQRVSDSSFNLAEGVLNATAFELARSWPETDAQSPNPNSGVCGSSAQTLNGSLAAPAGATVTDRIQARLRTTFANDDYSSAATTWKINICDDVGRGMAWSETLLNASAYDENGADAATHVRRMWVRAQADVGGKRRAVTGLVQVIVNPTFPKNYAAIAGGLSSDVFLGVNNITNGAILGPLTNTLIGNRRMFGMDPSNPESGHLGIRCGVLTGCVTGGLFAATSQTTLSTLLLANDVHQFGSATVLNDDQVSQLRRLAQGSGTYIESPVTAGAPCLPAGASGKVVFIEQIGPKGDSACRIAASSNAKALVVAKGRVEVAGGASSATNVVFDGVIYALFRQRNGHPTPSPERVVTIRDWAKVNGAVFIDHNGKLAILPPAFNKSQLLTTLGVCPGLLCAVVTNATNVLDTLLSGICVPLLACLNALSPTAVVNGLLAQLNGYGPAVQENDAIIGAVTTYGTSGTVQGTFRELYPI